MLQRVIAYLVSIFHFSAGEKQLHGFAAFQRGWRLGHKAANTGIHTAHVSTICHRTEQSFRDHVIYTSFCTLSWLNAQCPTHKHRSFVTWRGRWHDVGGEEITSDLFEKRHGWIVKVVEQIFEDEQHSRERQWTRGIQRMTSFGVEWL